MQVNHHKFKSESFFSKKFFGFVFFFIIAIVLFAYALKFLSYPSWWTSISNAIKDFKWPIILFLVTFPIVRGLFTTIAFYSILRINISNYPFFRLFLICSVAILISSITPFGSGGEIFKGYVLIKKDKLYCKIFKQTHEI